MLTKFYLYMYHASLFLSKVSNDGEEKHTTIDWLLVLCHTVSEGLHNFNNDVRNCHLHNFVYCYNVMSEILETQLSKIFDNDFRTHQIKLLHVFLQLVIKWSRIFFKLSKLGFSTSKLSFNGQSCLKADLSWNHFRIHRNFVNNPSTQHCIIIQI